MSSTTTPTLYDPDTHPVAAAYVDANAAERHAARETWLESDEERGYRFAVYRNVGPSRSAAAGRRSCATASIYGRARSRRRWSRRPRLIGSFATPTRSIRGPDGRITGS